MTLTVIDKRPKHLTVQSEIKEIHKYIRAEDKSMYELSDKLLELLERVEYCRESIKKHIIKAKVIEDLIKTYDFTKAIAEKLYWDTVFVYPLQTIYAERALENIQETRELCILKGNGSGAAVADKNFLICIKEFFGTKESLNYEEIQPPDFLIGFFPEMSKAKAQIPENEEEFKQKIQKLIESKEKKENYDDYEIVTDKNSSKHSAVALQSDSAEHGNSDLGKNDRQDYGSY